MPFFFVPALSGGRSSPPNQPPLPPPPHPPPTPIPPPAPSSPNPPLPPPASSPPPPPLFLFFSISAKFLSLAGVTCVQSLLLYGVMQLLIGGPTGSGGRQIPGLILASCAAVGIGLAISAAARSVLQAVMIVPLVLIPQILFSGFIPPAGDMKAGPYFVSRIMPSAAVQGVMDTSLFWQRKIGGAMRVDYPSAFSNLNRDKSLKNGQIYMNANPALWGLATLAAWSVCAYWAAWFALRGKERG